MGWKYRKRIQVIPGFRLNFSRTGMSATVGMRGLSVNVGKNGTYLNTGIPGTGIYDRVRIDKTSDKSIPQENDSQVFQVPLETDNNEIKSFQPELITSDGLFGLKESIKKAREIKKELKEEAEKANSKKNTALFLVVITHMLIFGIFIKWFRQNYKTSKADAQDAKNTYENFKLNIDFNMDQSILEEYNVLKKSFEKLITCQKIWDVTSSQYIDRVKERSAASTSVSRIPVMFSFGTLDYINTKYDAFKFHNANGGDLYIYPGFIVMPSEHNQDFAIIDFRDLELEHHLQRFVETESIPSDSKVIDRTWQYVNKNGSPDKRYSYNPEIPIVAYYKIALKSKKGLNECYHFSNAEYACTFGTAFNYYQNSLAKMKWGEEGQEVKTEEQPLLEDEQEKVKKNDSVPVVIESNSTQLEEDHLVELRQLLILETELDPFLIAMNDLERKGYVERSMEIIKKENLEYQLHYLETVRKRIKGYKKNKK